MTSAVHVHVYRQVGNTNGSRALVLRRTYDAFKPQR